MNILTNALLRALTAKGDDDLVDRLNSSYTVTLILICTIVATAKQYMGKPLQCWMPPMFTPSMEQYIESYCWIQNTYWLPLHEHIPDDIQARVDRQIGYYQWTPFILCFTGLMFYMPAIFWRLLSWQSGINIQYLVSLAREAQSLDSIRRQRSLAAISQSVEEVILLQNALRSAKQSGKLKWHFYPIWLRGSYMSMVYIAIKTLYTFNAVGQFFLLNAFMKGDGYTFYGIEVLVDLVKGQQWRESGHFPRVTLCDFEVRYLGNINRYTVQCALIANLFNEKIFALLWCWYLLLACVTTCSLSFWIINIMMSSQRIAFVSKYLQIASEIDPRCTGVGGGVPLYMQETFVLKFLRPDGVFILRMLASHVGDVITMEVVKTLWERQLQSQATIMENHPACSLSACSMPKFVYEQETTLASNQTPGRSLRIGSPKQRSQLENKQTMEHCGDYLIYDVLSPKEAMGNCIL